MAAVPSGVIRRALASLLLALCCTACVQHGQPPIADRSPVFGPTPAEYRVQAGDTLYSIAWRYGLDHKRLALANGIRPPYTIYPGQRLRLSVTTTPGRSRTPAAPSTTKPAAPEPPPATDWRWPTRAQVSRGYGRGNKGVDYRLESRFNVVSAASGEVVYAGKGLGGYRYLVIVKHGTSYLSAYSLNRAIRVKEGQRIKGGAIIADTDSNGGTAGKLHFEVRKDGDPVDPASVISS